LTSGIAGEQRRREREREKERRDLFAIVIDIAATYGHSRCRDFLQALHVVTQQAHV